MQCNCESDYAWLLSVIVSLAMISPLIYYWL